MPPPHLASLLRPAIDPSAEVSPPPRPLAKRPARHAPWLRPGPTPIPVPVVQLPAEHVPLAQVRTPVLADVPERPRPTREPEPPAPASLAHRPRGHRAWLTLLALLLLGPIAHAAGALGLPGSGGEFGTRLGIPLPGFAAAALFWCVLVLPAAALATSRRGEPVAILLVALFWSWTALHAASAQGWLPPVVPPLPFG